MSAFTAEGGSSVKLKKLAGGGYVWDVTVAAASSSLDGLLAAKETARTIVDELERELAGHVLEEVPY